MAMDTYHGHVRTPADAIKLFEACRLGLLPRVQRRLSEKERQSIRSGSVFVWDEREAGMRRWTDGKSWSASRVSGSFLTYREMEGKRGGGNFVPPVRRIPGKTPDSGRGSEDDDMDGEGPDGYRYKPDGLMKQSFSITTSTGQHLHLISYYSRPHPNSPELPQPTTDPSLRHIVPQKGMYPESTVHEAQGPAVTRAPMQSSPYMQSPQQMHPAHRGPPQPYPYQSAPAYAWPPSPMNTPPFQSQQQYPAHMYPSGLPPPPPGSGSAHNSPHQSHQHYSPHQVMQLPGSLAQQQGPPPPTIFDRPPPPLSDSGLPPPPPHHRGMSNNTTQNMPSYAPNPSPRVEQARSLAESQQIAQRALQSGAVMIDPRLTAPISLPPVQMSPRTSTPPQNTANSQANTPRTSTPPKPDIQTTPKANGNTSQAQTIPSISSLVHATDSASVQSDNKSNSSRAGSRSPKENTNGDNSRPQDIPHEKLNNLGEDQRAIRVLDRKFVF